MKQIKIPESVSCGPSGGTGGNELLDPAIISRSQINGNAIFHRLMYFQFAKSRGDKNGRI